MHLLLTMSERYVGNSPFPHCHKGVLHATALCHRYTYYVRTANGEAQDIPCPFFPSRELNFIHDVYPWAHSYTVAHIMIMYVYNRPLHYH